MDAIRKAINDDRLSRKREADEWIECMHHAAREYERHGRDARKFLLLAMMPYSRTRHLNMAMKCLDAILTSPS